MQIGISKVFWSLQYFKIFVKNTHVQVTLPEGIYLSKVGSRNLLVSILDNSND